MGKNLLKFVFIGFILSYPGPGLWLFLIFTWRLIEYFLISFKGKVVWGLDVFRLEGQHQVEKQISSLYFVLNLLALGFKIFSVFLWIIANIYWQLIICRFLFKCLILFNHHNSSRYPWVFLVYKWESDSFLGF